MLTVAKMGGGRSNYYLSLAAEDYYVGYTMSRENPDAVWLGKGAERLGLTGKRVGTETFKHLFDGFSPDGEKKLVQNAGRYKGGECDRMPGYDLTFGAPKSVSYAWAIGMTGTRVEIEKEHLDAIKKVIERIERDAATVRFGRGGRIKERAELVAAAIQHGTARQVNHFTMPDMHLHTHVTLFNEGFGEKSGKSGALNGLEYLNKNKNFAKKYGKLYREELARGLESLGFQVEWKSREEALFEISGIPESEIERVSKRTAQIEAQAPRAENTYREQKQKSINKRVAKRKLDPSAVQAHWHNEARENGITFQTIERLRRHSIEQERRAEELNLSRESLETRYNDDARGGQRNEATPRAEDTKNSELPEEKRKNEEHIEGRGKEERRQEEKREVQKIDLSRESLPAAKDLVKSERVKGSVPGRLRISPKEEEIKCEEEKERASEKEAEKDIRRIEKAAKKTTAKAGIVQRTALKVAAKVQDRLEKTERLVHLRNAVREYKSQGYKVVFVSYKREEMKELRNAGLTAAHVSVYLRDNETKKEKYKREHTRPKRTLGEIITFQNNFTPAGRKLYADYKYATGQWSKKAAQKYKGEYFKPTSEYMHQFWYLTGQISKKYRDYLDKEVGKEARKITDKTIVVNLSQYDGRAMNLLRGVVHKKGGKMVDELALNRALNRKSDEHQKEQEREENWTRLTQRQQQRR